MKLEHLNKAQRSAVVETEGPVMILAGAGSGKTRTLVSRIQYLLTEKNTPAFRILAMTFSNKAAREMRERIASDAQLDVGAIQITTFHSFCARLLRNEAQFLGLSRNFTIYDTSEMKSIVKTILGRRGITQKEVHPNDVLNYIDSLKNLGHFIDSKNEDINNDIDFEDPFYDYFKEYESELHKSNALDFGSLISGVLNLFENFPKVLERYQNRFKYLLIDEYQDTNRCQFHLIKLLSAKNKNICVVGDEDQSIYSWRGADIRNILDFEKNFPDVKIIKLEQNYRSSKNIIEAASCVISKNTQRKGKELWTDNNRGDSLKIIECNDDRAESEFIAGEVAGLIRKGADPQEIAIFYRTNGQSRVIEDALRRSNIPYRVVAGMKFYERKEIKDMLSYIRCVVNDKDSLALSRVINMPTRGIGARTLSKVEDEAVKFQISLWEVINKIIMEPEEFKHIRLSAKARSGFHMFTSIIHECKVMSEEKQKPSSIYEKILNDSGYLEALNAEKSYESKGRIESLDELMSALRQFEEFSEAPGLVGFLETITLDTEVQEGEEPQKEVSMMTIHGSKGLEYEYVFVGGAEEQVFPSFQSIENGEDSIEEERRLFYVAMTRAMKRLYICFAQGRMLWGQLRFNGPSRFLDEIPEEYYEWKSIGVSKKSSRDSSGDFDYEFSQESNYSSEAEVTYIQSMPKTHSGYPVGTSVSHKIYGAGKIKKTEGVGTEEKVVIKFSDGSLKKFIVKFAPLEKI